MPKGLLGASPRGGAGSPLDRELADAVRGAKAVGVVRALNPAPDPNLTALLAPVIQTVGEQLADQVRRTGQAPTADEVTDKIKRLLDLKTLNAIENPQPAPQPTSATEMMGLAQAAASIHQGAAETALAQAEQERVRRAEAEDSAGAQASYARQDEATKWAAVLEMTKDTNATVINLMQQLAAQQRQADLAGFQQTLSAINDKLEIHTAAQARELEARERLHASDLAAKDREAEFKLRELDYQHKLAAAPRSETPQDLLNKTWAEQQGRLIRVEADDKEAEAVARREREHITNDIYQDVREELPGLLKGVAGFLGGSAPAVRNGIPPVPPPAPAPIEEPS